MIAKISCCLIKFVNLTFQISKLGRLQLIFILLFSVFPQKGNAQLHTFRNYNHRDGLVMESVLSSAQDVRGYLWVGTDGAGLMRFDGTHFYEVGPSGKSFQYHVSSIYPKTDGTVYFTSLYDGIFRYANNKYELVYKSDNDGDNCYVSMVDSSLVIVNTKAISIVSQKGRLLRKITIPSSGDFRLTQVLQIPQGVLIFSTSGNYFVHHQRIDKLESWCGKYAGSGFSAGFGTFSRNKLTLYDHTLQRRVELVLTNDGHIFSGRATVVSFGNKLSQGDRVQMAVAGKGPAYIYTVNREIFRLHGDALTRIVQNYSGNMTGISSLSIDQNNDLWFNTDYGLFKVSVEPFTRVELHPMYADNTISAIHRTKSMMMILGTLGGVLRIGPLYSQTLFKTYNYRAYQISESSFGTFISTDKGLLELKGEILAPTNFPYQKGQVTTMVHWDGNNLWYALRGQGVVCYNPATQRAKWYQHSTATFPDHFYTAQNNFDGSIVYFGTNDGIYAYHKQDGRIELIREFKSIGSYAGISTTDRYGTCWFTLDNGLVGITSRGDYVVIDDERKLPSTLFYTLTSDNYGNLLVGTNRGINILEVDRNGHVVRQHNYSFKEGFGGYETNMRAQFQFGNYCYVGTIEGLYLINTEVLRQYPAPPKPVILAGKEDDRGILQYTNDKHIYSFKCLLPKSNTIVYSYRIQGVQDKWSDFSWENEIDLPELPSGEYVLEVRASYDGITVSPVASHKIIVDIPIWRTKWFIVVIVIVLGLVNIIYLEWSKSYLSNNIFDTKDVTVDHKMVPRIILFGFVVNAVMLGIVNMVDHSFVETALINMIFSGILFILFLVSRYYTRQTRNAQFIIGLFYVAYTILMLENFYLIYVTNVHPFPIFSIVLATSVIPFVVSRIRWVIIISLIQLFAAATLLIWLEDTVYNEILFIAAIAVSGGLAIMVTYLRNDSLEKLIFVSGVINKGNVMALSFNQKGIITYCSENITNFFAIDFTGVVGKPSSILNPFVATSEMRHISLRDEFEDGRIFLIPMYNKNNDVIWIEWSCKYFNDSVRVIMGQDVTDKLTLSTNYQSLVENAQDMIFHTDIDGNFIFANERCVQMFGYRKEAIIGKNSVSMVAPEHRERVEQFYRDQFNNRIHHTYLEFPIRSRDGRVFWVGQNVTMVYEPGSRKRISGFVALARDITEKRANDLLIEQQNKDITASINSAKRIQFNLLPDAQLLNRYFDQSFLIFKPKDIVSGDFYWIEEINNKLIVAVADCTGHGVPGAFMTILGINLLNQIVLERKECEPAVILNQLHSELESILQRNEGSVMFESMQVLLCVFEENELCYASSGVGFVHQHEGGRTLYRNTKKTKGASAGVMESYQQSCMEISPTDSFYLFTDGYQKQFGSIRSKKFGFRRIQELLDRIHVESMPLQKKYFENAWRNWSEDHEQTDDITILGLRGFGRKQRLDGGE